MAIKHAQVAVAQTVTSITASVADNDDRADDVQRRIVVTNTSAVSVYLGGSNVTATAFGYELAAGAKERFDLVRGDELFGIIAGGTGAPASANVNVLHLGV